METSTAGADICEAKYRTRNTRGVIRLAADFEILQEDASYLVADTRHITGR